MLLAIKHPRTIFRLAMASLGLFGVLGMAHVPARLGDTIDAARGALLGAAIGLIYLWFRRAPRGERS